jgi:hypothetical protein
MPESIMSLLDRTKNNLQRLSTTQPTTRGDVSQDLKVIASKLAEIDSSVRQAKSQKQEAEQTQLTLTNYQSIARQALEMASRDELKAEFNEQFVGSTNLLLKHLQDLASFDVWTLREKKQEVQVVSREMADMQERLTAVQERLNQVRALDEKAASVLSKSALLVTELSAPAMQQQLSSDAKAAIVKTISQNKEIMRLQGFPLMQRLSHIEAIETAEQSLAYLQRLEDESVEIARLSADLKALDIKIDARGRHLLDKAIGSRITRFGNMTQSFSRMKLPLAAGENAQLAAARSDVQTLLSTIDGILERASELPGCNTPAVLALLNAEIDRAIRQGGKTYQLGPAEVQSQNVLDISQTEHMPADARRFCQALVSFPKGILPTPIATNYILTWDDSSRTTIRIQLSQ